MMENFDTPYLSRSVGEFWRRWHISLSSWFRDYLYIPLGGSRKGKLRKYLNVMIVFIISGLWHGASWNFVVWGALNGLFQVLGDVTKTVRRKVDRALRIDRDNFGNRIFSMIITFLLIDFNWIFFRANSLRSALLFIRGMISTFNPEMFFGGSLAKLGLNKINFAVLGVALVILMMSSIANYHGIIIREKLCRQGLVFRFIVYYIGIFSVIIFGIYGPTYEASNFIYSQF